MMPGIPKKPQTGLVQDPLLESKGLPDFLLGLTLTAASLLGGEAPLECCISVQRGKVPTVLASNSERARRLDLLQHEVGEGPCLVALGGQSNVFVPDRHVYRHAQSTETTVRLAAVYHGIRLMITDNGTGFDVNATDSRNRGFGLRLMSIAVREANGTITLDSSPGSGTRVTITLPLD